MKKSFWVETQDEDECMVDADAMRIRDDGILEFYIWDDLGWGTKVGRTTRVYARGSWFSAGEVDR